MFQSQTPSRAPANASVASDRGGVSGVVERLLIEERRQMIDAQLRWISYARVELRAAGANSPGLAVTK